MSRRLKKMLGRRSGFTLIELMVVMLIVGILAAIAIPQFTGQAERAKQGKARADLKTIGTALEMYYIDNNELPDTDSLDFLVEAGYLRTVPVDPWGNAYVYNKEMRSGTNTPFTLYCTNNGKSNYLYYPDILKEQDGEQDES